MLRADELTVLPPGTMGPYVGARGDRRVLVWVSTLAGRRTWVSTALSDDTKRGAPIELGEAPKGLHLVTVAEAGPLTGPAEAVPGFVVVGSVRTENATDIIVMLLGRGGELYSKPVTIASRAGEVAWLGAVPVREGTLVFWASRRGDRADVHRLLIDRNGTAVGDPQVALSDVRAWQVRALPSGAAVAGIGALPNQSRYGEVRLQLLDERGRREGAPVLVERSPTADLDFDMVRAHSSLLLGWSDRRRSDSRLMFARVDLRGQVVQKPAFPKGLLGEQALVALVEGFSADGAAYAVWEDLSEQDGRARVLRAGTLTAAGDLGPGKAELRLSAAELEPLEWRASKQGLAALVMASACPREGACAEGPSVPTYVEWDSSLGVIATEPLRLDALAGKVPSAAWGLSCRAKGCAALAASFRSPAPVYVVELERRSDAWRSPARRLEIEAPPRAIDLDSVAAPESVFDVAFAEVRGQGLVAWVTDFDPTIPYEKPQTPAPDGRYAPVRALLQVRRLTDDTPPAPTTISIRAHSPGGVALAPLENGAAEALLAWTAIDGKSPQVFGTVLGPGAQRLRQRMLTDGAGDASEVALTALGDAWFAAWVRTGPNGSTVQFGKFGRMLQRFGAEQRLSELGSTATGPALAARSDAVLVAWSDGSSTKGAGDLFTRKVGADGIPKEPATRLESTNEHDHSPVLAPFLDGYAVAWLSDPSVDGTGRESSARLGFLDAAGRLRGAPSNIVVPGAGIRDLGLSCLDGSCQLVLSVDIEERAELWAAQGKPGETLTPRRLHKRSSLRARTQGLELHGSRLLYGDSLSDKEGRVRLMTLEWAVPSGS